MYHVFILGAALALFMAEIFGGVPDFNKLVPVNFFVYVLVFAILYRLITQWLDRGKG